MMADPKPEEERAQLADILCAALAALGTTIDACARTAESARQDHVSPGDQYGAGWNAACIYITGRIRAMKEEGDAG